jgi:hypothetical protein
MVRWGSEEIAMWLILLDCSGSMGREFEGLTGLKGRVKRVPDAKKLDAAKRALLDYIESLGEPDLLIILAFNDNTREIFRGPSQNVGTISDILSNVVGSGGTDIPGALGEAARICQALNVEAAASLLLISDGLSTNPAVEPAVATLRRLNVVIDVVLIDPTEKGIAIAKTIAGKRPIQYVESESDMDDAVRVAKSAHEALLRQTQAIIEAVKSEEAAIVRDDLQDISFSCGYSQEIESTKTYPLWVFVHQAELRDELARVVASRAEAAGVRFSFASSSLSTRLAIGTVLKILPRLPRAVCTPRSVEVEWRGDLQEAGFNVSAPSAKPGDRIDGSIDVFCGAALVGVIPVSLVVVAGEPTPSLYVETAKMFRSIFASYSHLDNTIVDACIGAYRALGMYVLIDKDALMAGEQFEPALAILIQRADLFQLFWSTQSKASSWVEKEWRQALALTGPAGRKGSRFIRPVYWEEPMPQPPDELAPLHFFKLDTLILSGSAKAALLPIEAEAHPIQPSAAADSIVSAVVSLVSGDPNDLKRSRRDVAESVVFIEETSGVRYYPVPTFMVDQFTVAASRQGAPYHDQPQEPDLQKVLDLCASIRAITLALHTRNLRPAGHRRSDPVEPRLVPRGWTSDAYAVVLGDCEGGIASCIQERFCPSWRRVQERAASAVPWLRNASLGVFLPWSLTALSEIHLALAQQNNRLGRTTVKTEDLDRLSQMGSVNGLRIGSKVGFDEDESWVEADFTVLTELYHVGAELLRHEQDLVTENALAGSSRPPDLAALSFVRVADAFGGLYRHNVGTRWPNTITLSSGLELSDQQIQALTRDFSPSSVIAAIWRRKRDDWAAAGLCSGRETLNAFCRVMLDRVAELLSSCLDVLGDFSPTSDLRVPATTGIAPPKSLGEIVTAFQEIRKQMDALLAAPRLAGEILHYSETRSTYGAFVDGTSQSTESAIQNLAGAQGLPGTVCMPGVPKVLICVRALVEQDSDNLEAIYGSVAELRRCVTLHEHFHAALRLGWPAQSRSVPTFARAAAIALEEALAAWMELHYARRNARLSGVITEYIQAGDWPDWPYRGAEALERLYKRGGLSAMKALIRAFGEDPATTATLFDVTQEIPWWQS